MDAVPRRYPFCRRDEIGPQQPITRWLDDLRDEVTAVELDGHVLAWSTICPHFGGRLEAQIAQGAFQCRWHGWRFDLRTGACLTHETTCRLRRYEVAERDGMLEIVYDR